MLCLKPSYLRFSFLIFGAQGFACPCMLFDLGHSDALLLVCHKNPIQQVFTLRRQLQMQDDLSELLYGQGQSPWQLIHICPFRKPMSCQKGTFMEPLMCHNIREHGCLLSSGPCQCNEKASSERLQTRKFNYER